ILGNHQSLFIDNLATTADNVNFIPYVADFVMGPNTFEDSLNLTTQKWTQYPGPRPAMCILYKPDPSVHSTIDPNQYTYHQFFKLKQPENNYYYFYHVPDVFTLIPQRLFAPYFDCYYDQLCMGEVPQPHQ